MPLTVPARWRARLLPPWATERARSAPRVRSPTRPPVRAPAAWRTACVVTASAAEGGAPGAAPAAPSRRRRQPCRGLRSPGPFQRPPAREWGLSPGRAPLPVTGGRLASGCTCLGRASAGPVGRLVLGPRSRLSKHTFKGHPPPSLQGGPLGLDAHSIFRRLFPKRKELSLLVSLSHLFLFPNRFCNTPECVCNEHPAREGCGYLFLSPTIQ